MVHERVPDRNTYGPLPDVVLDNVTAQDWALNVSEVLIMIMSNSAMVFIIFHKHRCVNKNSKEMDRRQRSDFFLTIKFISADS